jgi:hypothetical protein
MQGEGLAYLEVRLAEVLVLLNVEPKVERVLGGLALEEDLRGQCVIRVRDHGACSDVRELTVNTTLRAPSSLRMQRQ